MATFDEEWNNALNGSSGSFDQQWSQALSGGSSTSFEDEWNKIRGITPNPSPSPNFLGNILDQLGGNFLRDISGNASFLKTQEDAPLFGGVLRQFLNAASGKDIQRVGSGSVLGDLGQGAFNTYGKGFYQPEELPAVQTEMAQTPSLWDRIGAGLNIISQPLAAKEIAEYPFTLLGKELPLPKFAGDLFNTVQNTIPKQIISGTSKFPGIPGITGRLFGRFGSDAGATTADFYGAIKPAFANLNPEDLNTPEGQHALDWIGQMAGKINSERGANSPITNSDVLQAASKARSVWGDTLPVISKNMDNFATNMGVAERSLSTVSNFLRDRGIELPDLTNINLVNPEYMQASKTAGRNISIVSALDQIKKDIAPVESATMSSVISQLKGLEQATGHKLAFGNENFIFPSLAEKAPQLPAGNVGNPLVNAAGRVLSSVASPQGYTNEAKTALTSAQFRDNLLAKGIEPNTVLDAARKASFDAAQNGKDFSLFNASPVELKQMLQNYTDIDPNKWSDIKSAITDASKLPLDISGPGVTSLAKRIPGGVGDFLTNTVFGTRFQYNPIFQWVKLPTKLWEVTAAAGVKPWAPEAADEVAHYVENQGSNMISKFVNPETYDLQIQGRHGLLGEQTSSWMKNAALKSDSAGNFITEKLQGANFQVANFLDHITNADHRVYLKGIYQGLKDQGYDLAKLDPAQQLDYIIKQVPVEALGKADNFAKGLTRYGQGTSPLQNTINTVFFPALFHMKVAKYALAGSLSNATASRAIGALFQGWNKWSLSPEGQLWHNQNGPAQAALHMLGSAEPINSPGLTGPEG